MAIRIPFAYQEVEYIEAIGTQIIDLGIVPSNHYTEIQFDCMNYDDDEHILGTTGTNEGTYYHFTTYGNKYYWGRNGSEASGGSWTTGIHTLQYNYGSNYQVILDGAVLGSGSKITGSNSLVLFSRGGTTNFKGRVYWCKVTDKSTGKVVRDLVPCYRKADGVIGLYDTVNDTLFVNSGSGTFEIGPELNFVDRKFQPGIVGKTNVVEGAVISVGYEQLVNYTMLYDGGDQCTDITGGWTQAAKVIGDRVGTVTFNGDSVHFAVTASGYKDDARIRTSSLIALDGTYNKLWGQYVDMAITGDNSGDTGTHLYHSVGTSTTGFTDNILSYQKVYDLSDKSRYVHNLHVGKVTGNYYLSVGIGRGRDASGTGDADLTHAWLTVEDDWETLCSKAGITAPTDLATLIADTALMETIFATKSAILFMCAQCTGDFMSSVIADSTILRLLQASPYYTKVQANEHWAKFLGMVA